MKSKIYTPVGTALVRTPLLPMEYASPSSTMPPLTLRQMNTAIAVGSPSLYNSMIKDPASARTKQKVNRYRRRLCMRATPYGLFAGVALAEFADETNLGRGQGIVTASRLDMSVLIPLIKKLESEPSLRRNLRFAPNPELLLKAGRLWFYQGDAQASGAKRKSSMRATRPVLAILKIAQSRLKLEALIQVATSELNADMAKVTTIFNQLCDLGILISDLRCPLVTDNPLDHVLSILDTVNGASETIEKLQIVSKSLAEWDQNDSKTAEQYQKLLVAISPVAPHKIEQLVQTDTATQLEGRSLSKLVAEDLSLACELLLQSDNSSPALVSYHNAFAGKYQSGREVPLLELISEDFGLGSPYADLKLPVRSKQPKERDELLLTIASDALSRKIAAVELTECQLDVLGRWHPNQREAPASIDIFASVSAESRAAIDRGHFQVLIAPRAGVVGGGRALGRFAKMLGPEAISTLQTIARAEEKAAGNDIVADVTYWPDYIRGANVAITPQIREHTIAASCIASRKSIAIPLHEVTIGSQHGHFFARWTRTRQKIVARSSNMLNHSHMPDSIRFLVDIALESQPKLAGQFNWGAAEGFPFLPRITVGRIILRLAQWHLRTLRELRNRMQREFSARALDGELSDSTTLDGTSLDEAGFQEAVAEWRRQWSVPQHVQLIRHLGDDSPVCIDLLSEADVQEMQQMLAQKSDAPEIMQELISTGDWHVTGDKHFATEIVASFIRSDLLAPKLAQAIASVVPAHKMAAAKLSAAEIAPRDFLRAPGSDWLYAKISCSKSLQDDLVVLASELARKLKSSGSIESWFFVRYADPNNHLRIRFRVAHEKLFSHTMPEICQWTAQLIEQHMCSDFSLETYDREIERYGGVSAMALAEQIFSVDSESISEILSVKGIRSLDRRILAVMSIDNLLSAFETNLSSRFSLVSADITREDKNSVSKEFRKLKGLLYSLLTGKFAVEDIDLKSYLLVYNLLESTRAKIVPLATQLRDLEREGGLSRPLPLLCQSFVHMHCNRLLGLDRKIEKESRTLLANTLASLTNRIRASTACLVSAN